MSLIKFVYLINVDNVVSTMYNTCVSEGVEGLKTSLMVREIWGSLTCPVKSGTVSPAARHRCDVSALPRG